MVVDLMIQYFCQFSKGVSDGHKIVFVNILKSNTHQMVTSFISIQNYTVNVKNALASVLSCINNTLNSNGINKGKKRFHSVLLANTGDKCFTKSGKSCFRQYCYSNYSLIFHYFLEGVWNWNTQLWLCIEMGGIRKGGRGWELTSPQ